MRRRSRQSVLRRAAAHSQTRTASERLQLSDQSRPLATPDLSLTSCTLTAFSPALIAPPAPLLCFLHFGTSLPPGRRTARKLTRQLALSIKSVRAQSKCNGDRVLSVQSNPRLAALGTPAACSKQGEHERATGLNDRPSVQASRRLGTRAQGPAAGLARPIGSGSALTRTARVARWPPPAGRGRSRPGGRSFDIPQSRSRGPRPSSAAGDGGCWGRGGRELGGHAPTCSRQVQLRRKWQKCQAGPNAHPLRPSLTPSMRLPCRAHTVRTSALPAGGQ